MGVSSNIKECLQVLDRVSGNKVLTRRKTERFGTVIFILRRSKFNLLGSRRN